jgi:hypothetical protein
MVRSYIKELENMFCNSYTMSSDLYINFITRGGMIMFVSKIKKCLSVALSVLLLCTVISTGTAEAATSAGFAVNVSSVKGNVGEQVLVPVKFAGIPTSGISAADMTVTYDSNKLEYISGAAGNIEKILQQTLQ